jgi:DNA topoisomerase IB
MDWQSVLKYNPNHDPHDGRFTTSEGGGEYEGKGAYSVEKLLSEKYPGKEFKLRDGVPEMVREVAMAVDKLATDYPYAFKGLRGISITNKGTDLFDTMLNAWAGMSVTGYMFLNPHYWGIRNSLGVLNKQPGESFKTELKQAIDSGFHPDGTGSIKSIIDHEFGHHFMNVETGGPESSKRGFGRLVQEIQHIAHGPPHDPPYPLGMYARTNDQEWFACAFAYARGTADHPKREAMAKAIETYSKDYPAFIKAQEARWMDPTRKEDMAQADLDRGGRLPPTLGPKKQRFKRQWHYGMVLQTSAKVRKYNHFHDERGRFATAESQIAAYLFNPDKPEDDPQFTRWKAFREDVLPKMDWHTINKAVSTLNAMLPAYPEGQKPYSRMSPKEQRIANMYERQSQISDYVRVRMHNDELFRNLARATQFHGTTSEALDSIMQKGLVLDPPNRNFSPGYYNDERGKSVYLVSDPEAAYAWSKNGDRWDRGDPIVLKVKLPPEARQKLVQDEYFTESSKTFRLPASIPPEWIVAYQEGHSDKWESARHHPKHPLHPRETKAEDGPIYYTVIFCVQTSAISSPQPQSEKNQFSSILKFNRNHDRLGRFASSQDLPEEIADFVRGWTESDFDWNDYQHAARAVIEGMRRNDYLCYDCKGDDQQRYDMAKQVIDYINSTAPLKMPLYRGLSGVSDFQVGDKFSESLTSWTQDPALAERFRRDEFSPREYRSKPGVTLVLEASDAKGIYVSKYTDSPSLRDAKEWLTSGTYEVTAVEGKTVKVRRIKDADKNYLVKSEEIVSKFNPNHDDDGKFTTAANAVQPGHKAIPTVEAMNRAMNLLGMEQFERAVMDHLQSLGREVQGQEQANEIERVARRILAAHAHTTKKADDIVMDMSYFMAIGDTFRLWKRDTDGTQPRDALGRWREGTGMYFDDRNPDAKVWRYGGDHTEVPKAVADRLKALAIPPASINVHLNPDTNAPMQATWTAKNGKLQYKYSAENTAGNAAEKFSRVQDFNAALPNLRREAQADMTRRGNTKSEKDTAAVVRLMDKTGFRVGGEHEFETRKGKAYGASTLLSEHVSVAGNTIRFSFPGKHAVKQEHSVDDALLATYIRNAQAKRGPTDRLFDTTESRVNGYIKRVTKDDFSAKDFRTWHGTYKALEWLSEHGKPKSLSEYKKARVAVGDAVSAHLGNTRAVALNSYISPTVWGKWAGREHDKVKRKKHEDE